MLDHGFRSFSRNQDWWPDRAETQALRSAKQPPRQDVPSYDSLVERIIAGWQAEDEARAKAPK